MGRSSIMQRLTLLVAVPLVALAFSAGMQVWQSYQVWQGVELTQRLMSLSVSAGNLIHTLQIERGMTAGFVASKGQRFVDVLPNARSKTDERLAEFRTELSNLKVGDLPTLAIALKDTQSRLDQLSNLRHKANQFAVPASETTAYYTDSIGKLIDSISAGVRYNKDAEISKRTVAYMSFVRAKENAGLERALTTVVYGANSVESEQLQAIIDKISRQEAFLSDFSGIAGAAELASLRQVLDSDPSKEVLRMRGVLLTKATAGNFDINPATWFKAITEKIDKLFETETLITKNISSAAQSLLSESRSAFIGYLTLALLAIGLTVVVSLWVGHAAANPLRVAVDTAEAAIVSNDFTVKVPEEGTSEVARAGEAFNHLVGKFRSIIGDTRRSSERITQAADAMAKASRTVGEGSVSQSDAASSVAASVEQASVSISETAASARTAAEAVEQAQAANTTALEIMRSTVTNMNGVAQLINESGGRVEELAESSQRIGGIVQVIKEIADQTNLLALNAAIEAARAGEQGRGFAVVADEVRKLAERTAKATDEIAGLISAIQGGIDGTVTSMKSANQQADASVALVADTETALHRIDECSRAVAEHVETIANALREQDSAVHHIAVSVETIARMAEENSAAATSNTATASELDGLARGLRDAVTVYKV